jgi:phage-related protein
LPVISQNQWENNETNDGKESWRGKIEHLSPGTDSKNVFSPDLDAPIDSFSSLLHNRPSPRSINWLSQITETKRMSNIEQGMSNDEV